MVGEVDEEVEFSEVIGLDYFVGIVEVGEAYEVDEFGEVGEVR